MAGAIIGAVIGGSAFTAGSVFFGTTLLASAFTGASLGNMWDQHEAAKKQQAEMERARQDSLKLGSSNTKQADTPIGLVYGTCRVAGNIVYDSALGNTSGAKDMTWIISLGEGEISAVRDVKLNDKVVSAYPSCSYSVHVGTLAQAADSRYPSENFSNTAFLALTLHASDDLTGTPTVTSIVDGIKVLVWNKTSKTMVRQFSRNPAWVLYDVMTSIRYGAGIDPSRIDLDTFIECADYCDYLVDNGSGGKEPRFVFDAVINETQDAEQLMASIAASFRAFLVCIEGKYKLRIEKAELPIQSFEEGNSIVHGSMAINRASRIDGNSPNRIIIQYVDPVHWSTDEYTLDDDEDIALRGISDKTLSFIGIVRPTQAARTANYIRDMMNLCPNFMEFKVPFEKIECEPGDVVKITHSLGGYKDKLARVLTIELDEEFQLKLMCREYDAEVYSDDPNKYQVTSTSSFNGTSFTPPNVNALTAVETGYMTKDGVHVSDVNVYWEPMIYPSLKHYELYYQYEGSEAWIFNSYVQGDGSVIRNANTNKKMRVKVVTVSEWNRKSSGTELEWFSIIGKDAPPNNINNFMVCEFNYWLVFSYDPPIDLDFNSVEIRYGGSSWETSKYFRNIVTSPSNIINAGIPNGTTVFRAKAIDNVGNYCENEVTFVINITDVNFYKNIILDRNDIELRDGELNGLTRLPTNKLIASYSLEFDDCNTFDDLPIYYFAEWQGSIEYMSPVIDTYKVGKTGINFIFDYGFYDKDPMFDSFPNRKFDDYPFDTFDHITVTTNISIWIKTSNDNQIWGGWQLYQPGQYLFRYIQYKFDGIYESQRCRAEISKLIQYYDVPDLTMSQTIIVPATGLDIMFADYGYDFYEVPKEISPTVIGGLGNIYPDITNLTANGLTINCYDRTGTKVSGTILLVCKGY